MNHPNWFPSADATRLSRRGFLKYSVWLASLLALPAGRAGHFTQALSDGRRPPVIWLSFQECTGCSESLTRAYAPGFEELIFRFLSLEYHHLLQAASGDAAEKSRRQAIEKNHGRFLLVVDGSIPTAANGACSTFAGESNLAVLRECLEGAAAVVAIGSCASFGGLPAASPNPTGAMAVQTLMARNMVPARPLVNLPGCPPIGDVIAAVLAHRVAFGDFPELDALARPRVFYANTLHDTCSRFHHYLKGEFAESFDDEGARQGWCLYHLGCRGPLTHNACTTLKWNGGTSSPIEAGHPCIGCSEPGFWDSGPLYDSLDVLLPGTSVLPTPMTADPASAGRELYDSTCVYCHPQDAAGLRSTPQQTASLLRNRSVSAHRRLALEESEIQALQAFLESIK